MGMDNEWRERLREEATELEHKLIRLRQFINDGARFLTLTLVNQKQLQEQEDVMSQYHNILMQRLAN